MKPCAWCGSTLVVLLGGYTLCPHCDLPCARGIERCAKCQIVFPRGLSRGVNDA